MENKKDHEFCLRCGRKLKNLQMTQSAHRDEMRITGNNQPSSYANPRSCNVSSDSISAVQPGNSTYLRNGGFSRWGVVSPC